MLYILIPCIILLVVAIILKKRESANKEVSAEKSKKITHKAPTRSSRSSAPKPSANVSSSPATRSEIDSAPLSNEFKEKIEKLIQAENYFSAEAQVNQALNQNSAQHELYLYLLKIHLAQKDEFAIKQLINHLKSLGLYELADQITQKQNAMQFVTEQHPTGSTASVEASRPLGSDAAFDALFGNNIEKTETSVPVDAYKLNLDESPQHSPQQDDPSLDFLIAKKEPVIEVAPLDFTPTLALNTDKEQSPAVAKEQPSATAIEFDDQHTLEFTPSFQVEKQPTQTPADLETRPTEVTIQKTIEVKNDFSFGLDQSLSNDSANAGFDFTLDQPVAPTSSHFEPIEAKTTVETDPLAQSFPELLSTNDIQLNLDLAAQYIRLGDYDAAKQLIHENAGQYTIEQRTQSQKLLNQLAS